jgi:hypothetical protein
VIQYDAKMVDVALGILIVGALIAAIFGQKTAQSFVRFAFCMLLAVVGGFAYLLFRLDKVGGHEPYPAESVVHQAPVSPPAGQKNAVVQQHWMKCAFCDGTGHITCSACGGAGRLPYVPPKTPPGEPPPAANLSAEGPTCNVCGGSGYFICTHCQG